MLAFFLVAGTLAARPPADLHLVSLAEGTPVTEPGYVALGARGVTRWPAGVVDAGSFITALPAKAQGIARIVPDRAAPAQALVALARDLHLAGAREVRLVSERGGSP